MNFISENMKEFKSFCESEGVFFLSLCMSLEYSGSIAIFVIFNNFQINFSFCGIGKFFFFRNRFYSKNKMLSRWKQQLLLRSNLGRECVSCQERLAKMIVLYLVNLISADKSIISILIRSKALETLKYRFAFISSHFILFNFLISYFLFQLNLGRFLFLNIFIFPFLSL